MEIGLEVLQESYPLTLPRQVKVGQPAEEPAGFGAFLGSGLGFPSMQREIREINKVVELECRATLKDGEYRDPELLRARRRDDLHSEYEMWLLISQARAGQPPRLGSETDTPE